MKLRAGDFAQSTMDTDILQHAAAARQIPGRFRKLTREYFLVFVVLLGGGLIISGALEIYFRYI